MAEQTCRTCAWHDGFSWVCFNGDSDHRADFTQNEQSCPAWEQKAAERAQNAERAQKEP